VRLSTGKLILLLAILFGLIILAVGIITYVRDMNRVALPHVPFCVTPTSQTATPTPGEQETSESPAPSEVCKV
jgi:hypothetical protein